jgi:hypothetical protein
VTAAERIRDATLAGVESDVMELVKVAGERSRAGYPVNTADFASAVVQILHAHRYSRDELDPIPAEPEEKNQ